MIHPITAVFRLLLNVATRQIILFIKLAFVLLIAFVLLKNDAVSYANEEGTEQVYLPLVIKSPGPPPLPLEPVVANYSFEDSWTDLPPAPGYKINQQPNDWRLTWVEPGQPIFGSEYIALGVPECVHKLEEQLPPSERPGGSDPLILDGTTTYKIFSTAAFGAELEQVVTGLMPDQMYRITVPLRMHGVDSDPWGAESGLWVDGVGSWVNQAMMGDRLWYYHTLEFMALPTGEATVTIQMKSKYNLNKDFFIDNVQIEVVSP